MTRIAFVADLHCDDFGQKLDPETGLNARWLDTVAMVEWVVTDARARAADVLIIGGDFTESRHPAPWRVAQIAAALDPQPSFRDMARVLVRGNHDGLRAGQSIVDVLAAGRPGWHGFSQPGVAVVGDTAIACLPYIDRLWLRTQPGFETVPEDEVLGVLADQYLVIARGLYAETLTLAPRRVLATHIGLSCGRMSDKQQSFLGDMDLVVDSRALGAIGFDAVLAGHFHLHQVLQEAPLVAYAGAPYRTDFAEADQVKGYLVVDVDEAGVRWEFVETPARRFVTLTGDHSSPDFIPWDAEIVIDDAVRGAVVRVVDHDDRDLDSAQLRSHLAALGAWDVQEIRRWVAEAPAIAGGMSESLALEDAVSEYFVNDPDREALVGLGRELLAEVAS